MKSEIRDIVVIGGGLMGSSAAWHLSSQGENVLLLEQQPPVYTSGSSLGKTRIARSLGPKNDIFSFFHNRSVRETEKLVEFLNTQEDSESHQVDQIYTTSPVTYIYYESDRTKIEELLDGQQDPVEYANSAEEAIQKFGMNVPDNARVFRETKKHSGTLNPEALTKKLHTGIRLTGSDIQYHQRVTRLEQKGALYKLEVEDTRSGDKRILKSREVVSAAGPYTGTLLKQMAPVFNELITPKRVFLAFVRIDPDTFQSLSKEQQKKIEEAYPVVDFTPELPFAMIEEFSQGAPVFKVGGHLIREEISDLDAVWHQALTEKEKDFGTQTTCRYLQQLGIPIIPGSLSFVDGYSCVYSLTASEIPLVTRSIDKDGHVEPNCVVMGGMSGVGAKGAMTYGLIASNLLLAKEEESDIYQTAVKALDIKRAVGEEGTISKDGDTSSSWFISDH